MPLNWPLLEQITHKLNKQRIGLAMSTWTSGGGIGWHWLIKCTDDNTQEQRSHFEKAVHLGVDPCNIL
jgi:hypothetical protein